MHKDIAGYAIRFNETETTKTHLDVLGEYGKVLWGAWRKPGSEAIYSSKTREDINQNESAYFYAIGQTTVWKMHVINALTTEEVIEKELEYLIPSYYNIKQPVYIWYLIDDIKDYENRNCLSALVSSGGNTLENVHQIPGNAPWRVFTKNHAIEHYVPNIIPRVTKRKPISDSLRVKIFHRDNFTCQYCGRKGGGNTGIVLHVDHKVPVSKGGTNDESNLWTLCAECNLGKSNRYID